MQRVQRLLGQEVETPPKILEINRRHPLIRNLAHLAPVQANDTVTDAAIEQLFENLLLLEGLHPNPAQMVPRIQSLLEAATEGK
jgi:molecular chaperone HtpG